MKELPFFCFFSGGRGGEVGRAGGAVGMEGWCSNLYPVTLVFI